MAIYYLDTSALVKRYINEPGSRWIRQLCEARDAENELAHILVVADITMVEVAAALAILERRGIILRGTEQRAYRQFIFDWESGYRLVQIASGTIKSAAELVQRYPLKAYDAVHLALALETRHELPGQLDLIFVSGDQHLLQAAESEGLTAENPFTYAELDNSQSQQNPP